MVDVFEGVAFGLVSILSLIMALLVFSERPNHGKRREVGWNSLFLSAVFGLKSASAFHPYPKGTTNPFLWAFGFLGVIALYRLYRYWRMRPNRKAEQPPA
jgi:hypothetical protein